eukprot:TRINITY_DN16899_c0_g1_i1.p1 TRINITY_DN16899_c0_g1~~TRINITY_DN16899_c0_g1_i1.p1  ORF type:complete len:121 (-),score=9.86 TRINITY_DN16899_c0_g1_i1:10-372(-)
MVSRVTLYYGANLSVCGTQNEDEELSCCGLTYLYVVFVRADSILGNYITENGFSVVTTVIVQYLYAYIAWNTPSIGPVEEFCPIFNNYTTYTMQHTHLHGYASYEYDFEECEQACSTDDR